MGKETWLLPGAQQDRQSVTRDWQFTGRQLIEGVRLHEVRHVPTGYGYLTELFRADWMLDDLGVDQVFQSTLNPGGVSAWHAHERTLDRLFVNRGRMRVVLYDARPGSKTLGVVNEFVLGDVRPALVTIPAQVWHGIQNVGIEKSSVINLVDQAYQYEDPDHWRLPPDTPHVRYRFSPS